MEVIIIGGFFTLANIVCSIWNYEHKNYKAALANSFAAGFCFSMFIHYININ